MTGIILCFGQLNLSAGPAEELARARKDLEGKDPREAVSKIRRLIRGMRTPESVEYRARAVLAAHRRSNGNIWEAVELVEDFSDYKPGNIKGAKLHCFLEYARCQAAAGRVREAMKRFKYAGQEHRTEALRRVRVMAARAEVYHSTDAFDKAINEFEKALNYGRDYFRPKRKSAGSTEKEKVPGTDEWKKFRRKLKKRLDRTRRERDIERYGPGLVLYRIARRADMGGNKKSAIENYDRLIDLTPDSVYGEAARFLKAEALIDMGEVAEARDMLKDFINDKPLGLYRGEALYRLGEISLDRNWDTRQAHRYFGQVVKWTKRARRRERDVKLYVVPEKAREIAAPPPKPLKMKNRRLLSPDIKPEMIINRRTADWYLDRLQWRALYYLGLFDFVDEDYKAARKRWTEAFELSKQRQEQHASQITSFHRRLMNACRGERLVTNKEEFKLFKQKKRRLKIATADFYVLWPQWDKAEHIYRSLINSSATTDDQKACALQCLATAKQLQGQRKEANRIYKKIAEEHGDSVSAQPAYYHLGMETGLELEKKVEYLRKAIEANPDSDLGKKSMYMLGSVLFCRRKPHKAKKVLEKYVERYPDHRFVNLARKDLKKIRQGRESGPGD